MIMMIIIIIMIKNKKYNVNSVREIRLETFNCRCL